MIMELLDEVACTEAVKTGTENSANVNDAKIDESDPIQDIIECLINHPDVNFKSQQIGDSELTKGEKKDIAHNLYSKNVLAFLSKFGTYLNESQLDFFKNEDTDDCDVNIIITRLKGHLDKKNRKILTKNRRYEAMLKMLDSDTYFSEVEMMKRNPLLYEQLVGKYLSKDEQLARDNIDTKNITLLSALMAGMDKKITSDFLEKQKCEEECQMEESEDDEDPMEKDEEICATQWGEFSKKPTSYRKCNFNNEMHITCTERSLLKDEFTQEMYRSFLAGEDKDFDYSSIDNNSEYDPTDILGRDEEEKYFDSETPEEVMDELPVEDKKDDENDSEDELDVFMRHLNDHHSLKQNDVM